MSLVLNGSTRITTTELSDNIVGTLMGTPAQLTGYHYPSLDGGFRDLYRSNWLPAGFNQQWGGAQWGNLPDGSFGSIATGSIEDNNFVQVGNAATNTYVASGFILSEGFSSPVVWVKIYKVGNPVDNFTLSVSTSSGGLPSAGVGSAITMSGKSITSKTAGEWYPLTIPTGALSGNTQYHLALYRSGANDAVNYYAAKCTTTRKYPHGLGIQLFNASWSVYNTAYCLCFLVQNPAANSLIQSGGMFDYKLAFNPGTPWNQSRSVAQPLSNFYDGKNCTVLHRGTYAVSTNVWDFGYGLDHDRITLTINASGYPVLSIYRSDRTLAQVTGTGSVASGNHDVAIRVRTVGDGADLAYLYVDGVSVGTPLTAQTFTMDVNMKLLGTARLGDGFGIIPAWTHDMQMTSLPSAQGYTWAGTGTEANCMSVAGGKLYQNANGYTSTQTGYYSKTTAFNNATGGVVVAKLRVSYSLNSGTAFEVSIAVQDGTKVFAVALADYFLNSSNFTTTDFVIQGDYKTQEHVVLLQWKGSDYWVFIDGKLVIDGTGKLTTASATNSIYFGDTTAAAGQNADVIWSYVKYYQGGMLLPIATTGTCSEFAHWSGDKSAILPYAWNAGTPVSIKQLCGVERNYIDGRDAGVQREVRRGVTNNPSTASSSNTLITDMECYVIGSEVYSSVNMVLYNAVAGNNIIVTPYIDGSFMGYGENIFIQAASGYYTTIAINTAANKYSGLHKVDIRWSTSGSTATNYIDNRESIVEARS